ncbi:MAG: hypothetical protein L0H31_13305, partial [Nocardioidaceae bacterium]|nr:hypothetical protein [Nocardioidaceae bacterium]
DIVKLDASGDWESAVTLATTSGEKGSTQPLDTVNADLAETVAKASHAATSDLRSGRFFALLLSGLSLLLGIGAAVCVARGIGERRREFS